MQAISVVTELVFVVVLSYFVLSIKQILGLFWLRRSTMSWYCSR